MAKDNIANHSMRLNLRNEQHLRVHNVLKDLNPNIHKSANQFMVNAMDFYIRSFENETLTNEAVNRKQGERVYITNEDLEEVRKEMRSEMKDEIIRILGVALVGGQMISIPSKKQEVSTEKLEEDTLMSELVSKWG